MENTFHYCILWGHRMCTNNKHEVEVFSKITMIEWLWWHLFFPHFPGCFSHFVTSKAQSSLNFIVLMRIVFNRRNLNRYSYGKNFVQFTDLNFIRYGFIIWASDIFCRMRLKSIVSFVHKKTLSSWINSKIGVKTNK